MSRNKYACVYNCIGLLDDITPETLHCEMDGGASPPECPPKNHPS